MLLLRYFLICYCILLPVSNAKETKNRLSIYTMEQVPYGYVEKGGKTSGVLFEILEQIIAESDLEINNRISNELIPPIRLGLELTNHNNVCTILADASSIQDRLDWVEPIGYQLQSGVLPKAGIKLVDYSSLKNKTLAVALGIAFYEKFDNDKEIKKVRPAKYLNAIRMLKAGRVDGVVGVLSSLSYIARHEGMFLDAFDTPLVFVTTDLYLVCSKGLDKDVRNKLKQAVINLKLAGSIQKTLDKYFAPIQTSKKE
jgi:hypothetical protein